MIGDAVAQVDHALARVGDVAAIGVFLDQQREIVERSPLVTDVALAPVQRQQVEHAVVAVEVDHRLHVLGVIGFGMPRMLAQELLGCRQRLVGVVTAVQRVDSVQVRLRGVLGERVALGQLRIHVRCLLVISCVQRLARLEV
jgi:hypothetical protein